MRTVHPWLLLAALLGCSAPGAKSVDSPTDPSTSTDAGDGDADDDEDDDTDEGVTPACTRACKDFPEDPLVVESDPPITPDEIAQFADPDELGSGELCVLEPQLSRGDLPGAMLPVNWLRPRFR